MRTLFTCSALALLVIGCGDNVDNDPGGAGASGGGLCDPYFDEPAGTPVRVRSVAR